MPGEDVVIQVFCPPFRHFPSPFLLFPLLPRWLFSLAFIFPPFKIKIIVNSFLGNRGDYINPVNTRRGPNLLRTSAEMTGWHRQYESRFVFSGEGQGKTSPLRDQEGFTPGPIAKTQIWIRGISVGNGLYITRIEAFPEQIAFRLLTNLFESTIDRQFRVKWLLFGFTPGVKPLPMFSVQLF